MGNKQKNARFKQTSIRLSEREWERVDAAADIEGVRVSEFIRDATMRAVRELNK